MKALICITLLMAIFTPPVEMGPETVDIASWYGGNEKLNRHTASGEIFNPKSLTCASWDYAFGTRLKVINIASGKSVIVRVNDRGPNKRLKRAIDLTKGAFAKIADTNQGLALVNIGRVN